MSGFSLPLETEKTPKSAVDQDALRQFAAGARDHSTDREPYPWEQFDPNEKPRHNASVRLNDYELAILRFLAQRDDVSQQKVLNRILIPAIKEQVEELTGG